MWNSKKASWIWWCFEPLKIAGIWPLGARGKGFLCEGILHIETAEIRAQHEKSEDTEAVGTQ